MKELETSIIYQNQTITHQNISMIHQNKVNAEQLTELSARLNTTLEDFKDMQTDLKTDFLRKIVAVRRETKDDMV